MAVALLGVFVLIGFVAFVQSPEGLWLAALFAIGAVAYGRFAQHRRTIYDRQWRTVDGLRLLSGIEFEKHVAELYRKLGYHTEITQGSGDQGIDVIAQNAQRRIGIQCKQWQGSVGNDAVQQALAGKVFYNCLGGQFKTGHPWAVQNRPVATVLPGRSLLPGQVG